MFAERSQKSVQSSIEILAAIRFDTALAPYLTVRIQRRLNIGFAYFHTQALQSWNQAFVQKPVRASSNCVAFQAHVIWGNYQGNRVHLFGAVRAARIVCSRKSDGQTTLVAPYYIHNSGVQPSPHRSTTRHFEEPRHILYLPVLSIQAAALLAF